MRALFSKFSKQYPYLLNDNRLEYFSIFGGLDDFELNLFDTIDVAIENIIKDSNIISSFPFFILDEPFKKLLIKLANSDGKMYSLFKKVGIGEELGLELIDELIDKNILYMVSSREKSLKIYPKQKIKKELKYYKIEPKLYFSKPFYRFWFSIVEQYRDKSSFVENVISSYDKVGYRLVSLVYEQLSIEVLKEHYKNRDEIIEFGSYWDIHSEFDIYCKTSSSKIILGECKYKNRPITHNEFLKLKIKAKNSNLNVDSYALFSKSGFTQEFSKSQDSNLLLFDLSSLDMLIPNKR